MPNQTLTTAKAKSDTEHLNHLELHMPQWLSPLLAYLLGSLNSSILIAHIVGLPDPRKHGSKNPGATNMMRTSNKVYAAFALLGDAAKGFIAVVILGSNHDLPWLLPLCAMAVFLGHLFPLYHGFKGGKGVATGLGIALAISPTLALCAMGVWLITLTITRWVSLASILSALFLGFAGLFILPLPSATALLIMAVLLTYKHKTNIERLRSGTEPKI